MTPKPPRKWLHCAPWIRSPTRVGLYLQLSQLHAKIVIGSSNPDKGGDRNGVSKQLIAALLREVGEGKPLGTPAGAEPTKATLHPRLAKPTAAPSTLREPQRPRPATCSTSRVGWFCPSPAASAWVAGRERALQRTALMTSHKDLPSQQAHGRAHRGSSDLLDPGRHRQQRSAVSWE